MRRGSCPTRVVRELVDDLFGSFEKRPGASFAQPNDARISVNLDEQVAIDRDGFDASDLHVR